MRRVGCRAAFWITLATVVAGCGGLPDKLIPEVSTQEAEQGLVWMFPGLVGMPDELEPAYRAFRDAGLDQEVHVFQWEGPVADFVRHLKDQDGNRQQVTTVVADIVAYRAQYPDQPIDLVGYSAGGALAVWTAEELPPSIRIRNLVLAQPGLSPTYDLTAALQHVDGKLICFYAPNDEFMGGWFTATFGTLDGARTPAAARDGFYLEYAVPDPNLLDRVEQVGWSETMAKYGHPGQHMAILQYRWNKYFVAPYIVDPEDLRIESLPALTADMLWE